jgi:MFS family permease
MRLGRIGRSLSHRNFRLFFVGQSVSLLGTWMQQTAMTWLVFRLTGSAALLGVIGFASQFPVLLLAPFAGVLSDQAHRHRVIVLTQSLAMAQALLLGLLTLTGLINTPQIIAFSLFLGCVNAFDLPVRQSFLHELVVGGEDLSNAIALNSSMVNAARLVGPTIAGLLIGLVGEATCFLINAASYVAVIVSLLAIKVPRRDREYAVRSVWRGVFEGFGYAYRFPPVRAILLLVACSGLAGLPYTILMPVFAVEVLHGGPETLGVLMGAAGLGALAGSLYLASRDSVLGLGRWIAAMAASGGAGLIVLSFSRTLWFSLVCLAAIGFAMLVQLAACNTILQTIVDESKRGRVMSLYTMAFLGMTPIGSLLAGGLAESAGTPSTLRVSGACCLAAGLLFATQLPALRRTIRPIYARLGILPAVAAALQSTTEMRTPPQD